MNTRKSYWCGFLALGFLLVMAPGIQAAQLPNPASASPAVCNQALPDAVTRLPIPDGGNFISAATGDGCWIFVTVHGKKGNRLLVFSKSGGKIELQREIPSTDPTDPMDTMTWMRVTPDQKLLVVAGNRKFLFMDVEKIISGKGSPFVGSITDARFNGLGGSAISDDGKYLFVLQINTSWLTVIDLEKARSNGFNAAAIVGGAPVAANAIGLAISPDHKYVYISAGQDEENTSSPMICVNVQRPDAPPDHRKGALTVMSVKPGDPLVLSKIASIPGPCGWSWLTMSADGNVLYGATQEENAVFAYDIRPSREGKAPIFISKTPVGMMPSRSELIGDGHLLAVANSNRLNTTASTVDTLSIIDTRKIGTGANPVLGTIAVGADPRHFWVSTDGNMILVDSIQAGVLEIIDVQRLDSKLVK